MSDLHILCPHFNKCSGCELNDHVNQLPMLKEVDQFFRDNGIFDFKLQTGHATGWRGRAKLAIRGSSSEPIIGLFEKGSHRAINIPLCRVHHPAINEAVEVLRNWIIKHGIEPYNEVTHSGLLRYLQATVEQSTGKIQLCLVINSKNKEAISKNQLESLLSSQPNLWHSLWLNLNTRHDNIIFGDEWIHLNGSFWLHEALNKQQISFHPASFMQANWEMFERLVQHIERVIPEQTHLLEFYAGVGAMGIALAEKCHSVKCIELNAMAEQCFEETRSHLTPELAKRLSYFQGKSIEYLHLLNAKKDENFQKNIVLVDPPRKGLEKELLHALCNNNCINNIIYVSCGWPSFQHDCLNLIKSGWHLAHAEAYLFFPGSEHIEILAVFNSK